jgi:hypothetical protein
VCIDHLIGSYRLDNGFEVHAFRCTIVAGEPACPATGEIAAVEWHDAAALPAPRSNILHYALADALAGRRAVVRTGLVRIT